MANEAITMDYIDKLYNSILSRKRTQKFFENLLFFTSILIILLSSNLITIDSNFQVLGVIFTMYNAMVLLSLMVIMFVSHVVNYSLYEEVYKGAIRFVILYKEQGFNLTFNDMRMITPLGFIDYFQTALKTDNKREKAVNTYFTTAITLSAWNFWQIPLSLPRRVCCGRPGGLFLAPSPGLRSFIVRSPQPFDGSSMGSSFFSHSTPGQAVVVPKPGTV